MTCVTSYVTVLILFFYISNILTFETEITCAAGYYKTSGECKKCFHACESCTGSLQTECSKCVPGHCKNSENVCMFCISSTTAPNNNHQTAYVGFNTEDDSKNISLNNEKVPSILTNNSFSTFEMLCIAIIIGFFASICLCFTMFIFIMKKSFKPVKNNVQLVYRNGDDDDDEHMPKKVYHKRLPSGGVEGNLLMKQKERIANGQYGIIYKVPLVQKKIYIFVAAKITKPKNNYDNNEAQREREVLSILHHINIVPLIDINMKNNLTLIMPLREGNLKKMLQEEKDKITPEQQTRYCLQIADAFRYIAFKGFVHNDLKASNILVVNPWHIEVADFGSCCDAKDKIKKEGTITHTARELLDSQNKYAYSSEKTDVWSFGVTVWEIYTFGEKNPYQDEIRKIKQNAKVTEPYILDYLKKGLTLDWPMETSEKTKTIIIECWKELNHERPTFNKLFNYFQSVLPECENLPQQNKTCNCNKDNMFISV